MIWLTWRQFRPQAVVAAAALAVFAVALLATGPHMVSLYRDSGILGCHANQDCSTMASLFLTRLSAGGYKILYLLGAGLLLVTPAVIGIFWGAPLIAREVESGTFRLAWNQSVTRTRWLAVKLAAVGLASMAAAGLLSLMLTWWAGPIDRAAILAGGKPSFAFSRFNPAIFDTRGIVPIGYAAFAFALGVAVGMLIRRTLPAMAITLALFAAVQIVMPLWVRPHLITPVRATMAVSATSVAGIGIGQPGTTLSVIAATPNIPGAWVNSNQVVNAAGGTSLGSAPVACRQDGFRPCSNAIAQLHLRQLLTYQPASRYWAFQWYETAIFAALAVLLAGFCVWLVRRRLS
jgi:ABC-2 family transporter protein